MRERLYIAQDEGIAEIATKLASFQAEELILVVPSGAQIFESLENLVFLKDTAEKQGSRLSIETEDPRGQRLSQSLGLVPELVPTTGLPVYDIMPPSTPGAEMREETAPKKEEPPQAERVGAKEPPLATPRKRARTALMRRAFAPSMTRFLWMLVPAAVIGGILVLHVALAEASITLKLRRTQLPFSEHLTVRADATRIDSERRVISGHYLELRETVEMSFRAKEKAEVRERARGELRVVNAFSSAPQALVAGTRFATPEGKIFRTENRVLIPGAKVVGGNVEPASLIVSVVADEPGEAGNVKAGTRFTIPGFAGTPKFAGFLGEAPKDFAGGFVGNVFVVRQQDIEEAGSQLRLTLVKKLEDGLERQSGPGFTILDVARAIDIPRATSSVAAGGWSENFTLFAEGKLSSLAFRDDDLVGLLTIVLLQKDSEVREHIPYPRATFEFTSRAGRWDRLSNVLELEVRGSASLPERFDAELFRERILGKSEREVREVVLSTSAIASAELRLKPFWRKSVPHNPSKVTIRLE